MSKQADISLLIGAAGGYSANGESGQLIRSQLSKQLASGLDLKINTSQIANDLKKVLSNTTYTIKVKYDTTANSTGTSNARSASHGRSTSSSSVSTFEKEHVALATQIGKAYQAAKSFDSMVSGMKPDALKVFQSDIDKITKGLQKAITTGDKLPLAEVNAQIKELQYNLSKLPDISSYDNYVYRNNAYRAADQQQWKINLGLEQNEELLRLNQYYKDLEVQSAKAAAAQVSAMKKAESAMASAKSQLASFDSYLQRIKPKGLQEYSGEIQNIRTLLSEAAESGSAEKLASASNNIKNLKSEFINLGYEGGNAFTYLQDKLKTFSVYLLSSTIAFAAVSGIQNMIDTIYDLDEALTNLRIVMNSSVEDAQSLLYSYNQMAQELGSTTKSVADAAVEWQRQGFNLDETNTLIKDSMILSITGFIDSEEATTALTSAMKGYQVSVDEALDIVDKFVATDQVAATSAGDLAIALSKTAANAKLAGLSMDEVIAQLAVVNEVMQEAPESTGTFYNTMLSRMGMIKSGRLEDPETGESLSDVETTLSGLGIQLRDSDREFRNFGQVLDEVGSKWNNYSSVQQRAIATAFAGTRQQTRFLSLMSNWSTVLEYTSVSAESAGTALEKFGVYEESLEAKTNRATAAFENMAMSLVPTGVIGGVLDFGTQLFNLGAILGGLPVTIAAVVASAVLLASAFEAVKASSFGAAIGNTISSITGLIPMLSAAGVATQAFSAGQAAASITSEQLASALSILSAEKIASIAASQGMNEVALEELLKTVQLDEAKKQSIITERASIAAKASDAAVTNTATVATVGFKNALIGLATVMKAHPILLAITAITTLATIVPSIVSAVHRSLEDMQQDLQETKNKIGELDSEMESVQARIKELEGFDGLTTVEQAELDRLKTYNEYLEYRNYLLNQEQISQANEINDQIASDYAKKNSVIHYDVDDNGMPFEVGGMEEYYSYTIERYSALLEEQYALRKEYNEKFNSLTDEEREEYDYKIEENEKTLSGFEKTIEDTALYFSNQADALEDVNGDFGEYNEFYKKLIDLSSMGVETLMGGFSSSFAEDVAEVLDNSKFDVIRGALSDLARQGALTAEVLGDPMYKSFIDTLSQSGVIANTSADSLNELAVVLSRLFVTAGDAADEVAVLNEYVEQFSGASEKIEKIQSLMDDLKENDTGRLHYSFLADLYELLPEVAGQVTSVADAQNVLRQALADTQVTAQSAYGAMLIANADWVESTINNSSSLQRALAQYYENDVSNWNNTANTKLKVDQSLISSLSSLWAKYYNVSNAAIDNEIATIQGILNASEQFNNSLLNNNALGIIKNFMPGSMFRGVDTTPLRQQLNELNAIKELRKGVSIEFQKIDFTPISSLKTETPKTDTASTKEIEEYILEIDEFRDALHNLEIAQNRANSAKLKLDLIDENDVASQKKQISEVISLLREEQNALHALNEERDASISDTVATLKEYGITATYDATTNDFWVEDLEKINSMTVYKNGVVDQEATNELRQRLVSLIELAEEYADANKEGSEEWLSLQGEIYDLTHQTVELIEVSVDKFRDALNLIDDIQNDMQVLDIKMSLIDEDDVETYQKLIAEYIELIDQEQDALHVLNNERDAEILDMIEEMNKYGLGATYDPESNKFWVAHPEKINDIKVYNNGVLDGEATNTARENMEELVDLAEQYANENIDGSTKWWSLEQKRHSLLQEETDLLEKVQQERIEALTAERDLIDELVELEKDRIRQAGQDLIDSLEAEIDAYSEIIEKQKESLQLREKEKSYEEEVSDLIDDIADLQAKADALALDDSRAAQIERNAILEEIAEKQKELGKVQNDYAIENTEDALDDELDLFKENQNQKIDEIEDFLDDEQKLTELAYQNIQNGGQETFDKLLNYCLRYTNVSRAELTDMWNVAMAKVQEYGSLLNALGSMNFEIDMSEGNASQTSQSIVDQMRENSTKWHGATAEERKGLEEANQALAAQLSDLLGVNIVRGNDGHWYIGRVGGTKLFHSGGVVGGSSSIKQNELMILAEKGELVLTQKHQDNILHLLRDRMDDLTNHKIVSGLMSKMSENTAVPAMSIDASVNVNGGMVDDAVLDAIEKNQRKISNMLNKIVLHGFK